MRAVQLGLPQFVANTITFRSTGNYTCRQNDAIVVVKKDIAAPTQIILTRKALYSVLVIDGKGDAAINNITVIGMVNSQTNFVMNQNYQAQGFYWNGDEWSLY